MCANVPGVCECFTAYLFCHRLLTANEQVAKLNDTASVKGGFYTCDESQIDFQFAIGYFTNQFSHDFTLWVEVHWTHFVLLVMRNANRSTKMGKYPVISRKSQIIFRSKCVLAVLSKLNGNCLFIYSTLSRTIQSSVHVSRTLSLQRLFAIQYVSRHVNRYNLHLLPMNYSHRKCVCS